MFGDEDIDVGRLSTVVVVIVCDYVLDGFGLGFESVEVGAEHSESRTAKACVEVGRRVGFDYGFFRESEGVVRSVFFLREEVSRIGDVSFGPSDFMHFGKVLDKVRVSV